VKQNKIDADFRAKHPQIEWKKIAGSRDIMIHDISELLMTLYGTSLKKRFLNCYFRLMRY